MPTKLCSTCAAIPTNQNVTRRTITIDLFCDFDDPTETLDSIIEELQEVVARASDGSAAESRAVVEEDRLVERDEAPCMGCGNEHGGGCECGDEDEEEDIDDDNYDDRRDFDHDLLSHEVDSDPYDRDSLID